MSQPVLPGYQVQKENKTQTRKTVSAPGVFSAKLISELKSIVKAKFDIEISDVGAQEIGRHIAQFVFSRENCNALQGFNDKERTEWI